MDANFSKELAELLKKHGLQEGAVAPESEKKEVEETPKTSNDPKVMADLADSIAKKLTDAIERNRPDKVAGPADKESLNQHIKNKIFTSWGGVKEIEYPSDLASLTKEEKIVNFFKALVYHKVDPASNQVLRALVEGTSEDGGYLVPEELRTEVFRVLPDITVMRNIARVLPMSTDTLKLNSLSARPTAYWTAEYGSKSTTSAEFGQITLSPNDLVCLLPISEQLLADANINLVSFITELFAEAIGAAEDKAFFIGSGTGQPKGINAETITSIDAGGTIDFDNIIALIDKVPQRVTNSRSAAFVGHRYVKQLLRTLKNTTNNDYIWRDGGPANNGQVGRLPSTVYGYPFYEQNDLPHNALFFGDWSYYIIGDRQVMSVKTTTEGGDAWRRNAMEIKAVERVDGKAVITSPFAKITNA